jgi:foldase protein PrsA
VRPSARPPVLLLAALLVGCSALDTAAAVVDGERIAEERFRNQVEFLLLNPDLAGQYPGEQGTKDLARDYLTFLIHQVFVERFARQEGIAVPEAEAQDLLDQQVAALGGVEGFEQALAQTGASQADVIDLVTQPVLRAEVSEALLSEEIPEEQLREEYESRIGEFTTARVSHILLETQQEAQDLARRVTPANFAEMASRFSADPSTAPAGGDLGVQRLSDLVEPFAQAVLDTPVGEVGGPVKTQFGYHLILVSRRDTLPFEEVQVQLVAESRPEVFNDWLLEQVDEAEIRVNPRYGYFDLDTGQVLPRTATTPSPPPSVQVVP